MVQAFGKAKKMGNRSHSQSDRYGLGGNPSIIEEEAVYKNRGELSPGSVFNFLRERRRGNFWKKNGEGVLGHLKRRGEVIRRSAADEYFLIFGEGSEKKRKEERLRG